MRSWLSPWRMRTAGWLLLAAVSLASCKTTPTIEPYACEPFPTTQAQIEEYEWLRSTGQAPLIRAWIREADRVCRANNALREP